MKKTYPLNVDKILFNAYNFIKIIHNLYQYCR